MAFKKGCTPWNKGREIGKTHPQMGFQKGNAYWDNPQTRSTQLKKGVQLSPETQFQIGHVPRLDNRRSFAGDQNPAWKGGIEFRKKSDRAYDDSAYMEWRKQVKNRDGWKCKIASKDCHGRLEAHHILPWRDYPELRYETNNGITLCQAHHPRKRAEEKRLAPLFQELVTVLKD